MFTLQFLGGASILGEAGPVTGPATQRHRIALIALLATAPPGGIARDKLVAYLWPERDTFPARNSLNQAVHILRRALGEAAIVSAGEDLRLDCQVVRTDVLEFGRALGSESLERAVALYRGPFLDGFFLPGSPEFERWVDAERSRFEAAYRQALEGLARAAATEGDRRGAVEWWRRLATEDPYSSRVTLAFMSALEDAGERADALQLARDHTLLLEQEFGAEPDPAVAALAERMRAEPAVQAAARQAAHRIRSRIRVPPDFSGSAAAETAGLAPGPTADRRWKRAMGLLGAAILLPIAGWALADASGTFGRDAPEIRRLAVLPLANLTGDPRNDYFVAGMHDALVAELGQIADLTVISRQSVLRYQGSDTPLPVIAGELEVDALVAGAVFLAGDSVRVTAQLVRASPEEHLWAGLYHGALGEALTLQGTVAHAIAGAIRGRLTAEAEARLGVAQPVKPEAQEAYLRGSYHVERHALGTLEAEEWLDNLQTGVAELERAVALEPGWAGAHAKLALAYQFLASGAAHREYYPKSKAAALRALDLDDTVALAHASLGLVLLFFDGDWSGAERSIRRALELDPNAHQATYAIYLRAAGQYDAAVARFRLAEERNPLSRALKRHVVTTYVCAGLYDEAMAQAKHVAAIWPDHERSHIPHLLGMVYTAKSMHVQAIAEFEQAVALSDSASWAVVGLAYAHARSGEHDEARRLMERSGVHPYPSVFHVALGEMERALEIVEENLRQRGLWYFWDLRCFPEFEALRAEPRIEDLMRRNRVPG